MENEEKELQDSQTPEEEQDSQEPDKELDFDEYQAESDADDYDTIAEKNQKAVDKLKEISEKNRHLFARVKKAEEKAKAEKELKPEEKKELQQDLTNQGLSREEAILITKGVPLEDIDYLRKVQSGAASLGEKTTLLELAEKDAAYLALKDKREAAEKEAKAQLGASGKSGTKTDVKLKPGMTEEEHRKVWAEEIKKL